MKKNNITEQRDLAQDLIGENLPGLRTLAGKDGIYIHYSDVCNLMKDYAASQREGNTPKREAIKLLVTFLKVTKERVDTFASDTDLLFAKKCAIECAERCKEIVYCIPVSESTFDHRNKQLNYWEEVIEIIKNQPQ